MLVIKDLVVQIGPYEIVSIESFEIPAGRRVGLVGESGSGKTMTAMSIVGLQPHEAILSGSINFQGRELVGLSDAEMARIRGAEIGLIQQDPTRALNPTMRIGRQVAEAIRLNTSLGRAAIRARSIELLKQVQLSDAEALLSRYPHQLSGGQQQRVLIAMAIAANPKLLIADEPTTALDVTVQNEILRLIVRLSEEHNMGLLFVSHELGVVRSVCEEIGVFYGGHLVEFGSADVVVENPYHRYTEALIGANPGLPASNEMEGLLGKRLNIIEGSVPPVGGFPAGCRFRGRCHFETERCAEDPVVVEAEPGHRMKCWNPVARRMAHAAAG